MDAPNAKAPPLRANLLGPARLMLGEAIIPDSAWPRRAGRSLLLLLLVSPGHHLPRERVLDTLWPDATPESAERSLRKAVHVVRRVLQPDLRDGRASAFLEVAAETVSIRAGCDLWVDVDAFEECLASARPGSPEQHRTPLRQAVALYDGELLAGDPYAEWIDAPRERLRRLHRRAVLELAELDLKAGQPATSIPMLERLLETDGTDEPVLRGLMRALASAGQRDDALLCFQRGTEALRSDLDTEPEEETQALANDIRALTPAPVAPLPGMIAIRPQARVPAPPNPLVGRLREMERLQDLLFTPDIRLVTVTGPGGVGKTRLVQEAARQVAADFADGVCFVALASVRDPSFVMPTIASALGIPESGTQSVDERVTTSLQGRDLLLVLDNLEQVIEAAPQVARLLESCGRLKILATSREPLRVRAEYEVDLPALSVPHAVAPGRGRALVRYEAVELFLHRAHAAWPAFVLTDDNAVTIATICQRLDGLPLAIELAAAQTRTFSPEQLLAGLSNRFALLAGGYRDLPDRQQSLHNAIGWSYGLLTPPLRALFRQLAIFSRGFTADAAGAVARTAGTPGQMQHRSEEDAPILAALDSLVTRSLLIRWDEEDGVRFSMLESIREYGLNELSAEEKVDVRRQHAAWFLAFAEQAEPELTQSEQITWTDWLEADLDNFRASLEWSLEQGEAETALRISSALRRLWFTRGYLAEGREWLERALAQGEDAPLAIRVRAIFAAGELSFFLEDHHRAKTLAEEGLAICRSIGDTQGIMDALLGLGHIARLDGDFEEAVALLQEGILLAETFRDKRNLALLNEALGKVVADQGDLDRAEAFYATSLDGYQEIGYELGVAANLSHLADLAQNRGDPQQAISLMESALKIVRRLRDAYATATILHGLGHLVAAKGDHIQAAAFLRESLAISWERRLDAQAAACLQGLASLAAVMDEHERAARLFGATQAFCQAVGTPLPVPEHDVLANGEVIARAALDERAFTAAEAQGRALSPDQAVAEGLSEASSRTRESAGSGTTAPSRRSDR